MYKEAEEQINEGLSPVARVILGFFSGLFGVMMILIAPPTDKDIFFYMFGGFCLLIFFACVTKGKVRQFIGSTIGCSMFALSLVYFGSQLVGDIQLFSKRSQSSLFNSILFFVAFGIPGISYAVKAKFGRASAEHERQS